MQEHADSIKTYTLVFLSLLLLTGATTVVATIDLGAFNVVMALLIAVVKMMLVALFFMHLRHSGKVTQLAMAATVLWLGIMVAFTFADVATRGWMEVPGR
jgi:cytochrome c oxidase subunit 4